MKKIRVMCTSTGCLEYAPDRYKKLGIDIIRIRLVFEGKEYLEGLDLDPVDMYAKLADVIDVKGNLPTTAVPTYEEVSSHFQKAIDDGIEEVFVIAIDSYLGGTYNFINLVAKEFEEKLKITVIDSKICSLPEGFLAAKAVEFFEKGYKTEDVVKEINWMIRHQEFIGVVQKLDYLIYNGRLKGGKAYLGKLMGICPVLHFNRAGEIVALENKMGIRNALKRTMEIMREIVGDRKPEDYVLAHVYTTTTPLDRLEEMEKKAGFAPNHEAVIMSPVSGCHVGPWLAGYTYTPIRRPDEDIDA